MNLINDDINHCVAWVLNRLQQDPAPLSVHVRGQGELVCRRTANDPFVAQPSFIGAFTNEIHPEELKEALAYERNLRLAAITPQTPEPPKRAKTLKDLIRA